MTSCLLIVLFLIYRLPPRYKRTYTLFPYTTLFRSFIGESALRVWREFRGLEITDLRRDTGIAVERLDQIEAGKSRKMSEVEERALARSLEIGRASLRPMIFAGCSGLGR